MTKQDAIAIARADVERLERDPYKAPELVEEARQLLRRLTASPPQCTCDSDDVPFCVIHCTNDRTAD